MKRLLFNLNGTDIYARGHACHRMRIRHVSPLDIQKTMENPLSQDEARGLIEDEDLRVYTKRRTNQETGISYTEIMTVVRNVRKREKEEKETLC